MIRANLAGASFAALLALCAAAHAQDRVAMLGSVKTSLAAADPLQRLANLEAILAKNDAVLTDLAIREAAASADAQVRGLAMRAYIASAKQIQFEVKLPDEVARRFDASTPGSSERGRLLTEHPYLQELQRINFRVTLAFTEFDVNSGRGVLDNLSGRNRPEPGYTAEFRVAGDKLSARSPTFFGSSPAPLCTYDIRPAPGLRLAGAMACEHSSFPRQLRIESEMF